MSVGDHHRLLLQRQAVDGGAALDAGATGDERSAEGSRGGVVLREELLLLTSTREVIETRTTTSWNSTRPRSDPYLLTCVHRTGYFRTLRGGRIAQRTISKSKRPPLGPPHSAAALSGDCLAEAAHENEPRLMPSCHGSMT